MVVMMAVLSLLCAGLLALAGLHAENVRGIRHWALASLCISLGLGAAFAQPSAVNSRALVFGSTLVGAGLVLYWMGIQAFMDKRYDSRIPWAVIGYLLLQSILLVILHPDPNARAIGNSMVFALTAAACARSLLIPIAAPLRTACWFTGGAFSLLTLVLLARVIGIVYAPGGQYGIYSHLLINPVTFLAASMAHLCLTFGLVLMLNYRLATDLHNLAARDYLTGALNRRSLEEEAERQWARASRTGDTLAVMMLDIDHFKSINDRYGHPSGDEVLRNFARLAKSLIRSDDYFARYGGEEFCILLPSSTEEEVRVLAERLRQSYAAMLMTFGKEILQSTVSIGVADSRHAGFQFPSLIAAADKALYHAKQEGRDRVMTYSQMMSGREV